MASPESLRLFVAVEIPSQVRHELQSAQEQVQELLSSNAIKWTRSEQFHLTLRFLGSVDLASGEILAAALQEACRGFSPLSLRAERLGFFPNHQRPRVIWAGVNDSEGMLMALQRSIVAASLPFTREPPEEKFTGHITLGRIRELGNADRRALREWAASGSARFFGEWSCGELFLMQSQLRAGGAVHRVHTRIELGKMKEEDK